MFRFQRFLPNSLRMRFLLVSSLIFQLAKAFLDTEDKSWLVYLTYDDPNKWPMNTFDQRNCSVPPSNFTKKDKKTISINFNFLSSF